MTIPSKTIAIAVTINSSTLMRGIGECAGFAKSFIASLAQALAQSTAQGLKLVTVMSGLSRKFATMARRHVAKSLAEGIRISSTRLNLALAVSPTR